jgi:hypothetical protein
MATHDEITGKFGQRPPEKPDGSGTAPFTPKTVGLPPRPFLYTEDQIAGIIGVQANTVKTRYLWYEGREVGAADIDKMIARNIAPATDKPEWRVAEGELVRWLRRKGFKFYERKQISPH